MSQSTIFQSCRDEVSAPWLLICTVGSQCVMFNDTTWCRGFFPPGIFSAILGRGPRAFLIGKISDIYPEFGKFSKHSKFMIFSNLT